MKSKWNNFVKLLPRNFTCNDWIYFWCEHRRVHICNILFANIKIYQTLWNLIFGLSKLQNSKIHIGCILNAWNAHWYTSGYIQFTPFTVYTQFRQYLHTKNSLKSQVCVGVSKCGCDHFTQYFCENTVEDIVRLKYDDTHFPRTEEAFRRRFMGV